MYACLCIICLQKPSYDFAMPCKYWRLNLGPLEEQSVLLAEGGRGGTEREREGERRREKERKGREKKRERKGRKGSLFPVL